MEAGPRALGNRSITVDPRDAKMKDRLNELLSKHTGQKVEKVEKDTDRDYFMSPEEAVKYGLADKIIR